MSTISQDLEKLHAALLNFKHKQLEPFLPESLAWLCLPPVWTEELASKLDFPVKSETLSELLTQMEKEKLCVRHSIRDSRLSEYEILRTLVALWPMLPPKIKDLYRYRLRTTAVRDEDRTEALHLLIVAASTDDDWPRAAWDMHEMIEALPGFEYQARNESEDRARLLVHLAVTFAKVRILVLAYGACQYIKVPLERVTSRIHILETLKTIKVALPLAPVIRRDVDTIADPSQRALLYLRLFGLDGLGGDLRESQKAIIDTPDLHGQALYYSLFSKLTESPDASILACDSAIRIQDSAARCRALVTIAGNLIPAFRPGALKEAWKAALNVQDSVECQQLLTLAAAQWFKYEPDAVRAEVRKIEPVESRVEVMLSYLPYAENRTRQDVEAARSAIASIPLIGLSKRLLLRLAAIAPPENIDDVYELARSNDDDERRRNDLLLLLPHIPKVTRHSLVEELIEDLWSVADPDIRRPALVQIAPHCDSGQMMLMLKLVTEHRDSETFTVNPSIRDEIIDYLIGLGQAELTAQAIDLANKIVGTRRLPIHADTLRWARLAQHLRAPRRRTRVHRIADSLSRNIAQILVDEDLPSSPGSFLRDRVQACIDANDRGAALAWLNAARFLEPIAEGDLVTARLTGKHRVDLMYRRAMDEHHLRRYMDRTELSNAFCQLRDGPDDRWALHYLGMGGVGKTMLIRHIVTRLAIREGRRIATAIVDFDHMNPEFPSRKPGQLLAELAADLRIYGGSSLIEKRFTDFHDRLLALHGELSEQASSEDPLESVRREEFDDVLNSFADLLRYLPAPVVLILDTCEELSKLEEDSKLPGVDATYTMLERLHEAVPSMRVVFSGRRLLAQAGDGDDEQHAAWRSSERAFNGRNRYLPAFKSYLRLQLVQGFTDAECDRYFTQISDLQLDPARKAAVLERSPDFSPPERVEWTRQKPQKDERRFNPFDLALYAEWLREAPSTSLETISSGQTEPYVEMRIVRRLENEPHVLDALPYIVLLRRFDVSLLKLIDTDDGASAKLFHDLQGHEWTTVRHDMMLDTWFLEIDPNLRQKIERYYKARNESLLDEARLKLAPQLDTMIRRQLAQSNWFDILTYSRIESAMRLLQPKDAALLWAEVDAKVSEYAEWNWASHICPLLLGEGNCAADRRAPLRAAIRATFNAAVLHLHGSSPTFEGWKEVLESATAHPVPAIGRWLAFRARVMSTHGIDRLLVLAQRRFRLPKDDPYRFRQSVATVIGRLYVLMDVQAMRAFAEQGQSSLSHRLRARLDARTKIREKFPTEMWTAGDAELRNLAALVTPDFDEAAVNPQAPVSQHWADWRLPDHLTDRLRLELSLDALATTRYLPDMFWRWALESAERLNNIDSERLLSVLFDARRLEPPLKSLMNPAPLDLLRKVSGARVYDPARVERCGAHRMVRPLYIVLADQLAAHRQVSEALWVLSRARTDIISTRKPQSILRPVLELERRLRNPRRASAPETIAEPRAWPFSAKVSALMLGMAGVVLYPAGKVLNHALHGYSSLVTDTAWLLFAAGAGLIVQWLMFRFIVEILQIRLVITDADGHFEARMQRNRFVPWLKSAETRDEYKVQLAFERRYCGPYASRARAFPSVARPFVALRRLLIGGILPVRLVMPADLQGTTLEPIIRIPTRSAKARTREFVQFFHAGPRIRRRGGEWRTSRDAVLLGPPQSIASLEQVWTDKLNLVRPAQMTRATSPTDVEELDLTQFYAGALSYDISRTGGLRVVHLVCRNRKGSGARQVQVTRKLHCTASEITAGVVSVFIVQCPVVESLQRSDTDREQIAALRGFAAEVFDQDAQTVIFLPQMPSSLSDVVAGRLARFCARSWQPSRHTLLHLVRSIREVIRETITPDRVRENEEAQRWATAAAGSVVRSVPNETGTSPMAILSARDEMAADITVWTRLT